MQTRKQFLTNAALFSAGSMLLPSFANAEAQKIKNVGVQLYTFRTEMAADALGTLQQIAAIGIK